MSIPYRASNMARFAILGAWLVPYPSPQVGLDKIISTQEQVGGLQEQLTAMEPVLIKTQAEVEGMIVTIVKDKEEASKTQNEVQPPPPPQPDLPLNTTDPEVLAREQLSENRTLESSIGELRFPEEAFLRFLSSSFSSVSRPFQA